MTIATASTIARIALAAVGLTVSTATLSDAQTARQRSWEIRVTGGELVPTGDQRDAIEGAKLNALQVSWLLRPSFAITGTLGWARSKDVAAVDRPKLNVFTSDLGVEVRPSRWFAGNAVEFDAFAGVGAGARSYDYRNLDAKASHNLAGYAAAGGELGIGRVGVRIEVRDYVTGFKPLIGTGQSRTRNDVVVTAAVRINRNSSR